MQQKQSSLERQALLLFYGPILLSNVINEHINSTHYINSACVRVNVWGCVWLLVAAIQWAKAFACLWPSLCSTPLHPIFPSLTRCVVVHFVLFFSLPMKMNECAKVWKLIPDELILYSFITTILPVGQSKGQENTPWFICTQCNFVQTNIIGPKNKWLYGQKMWYKVALLPEPHCSL